MTDSLFELADFEPAPVYTGPAPLGFTVDYFTPDKLIDADRFAGRGKHTWRPAVTLGACGTAPGHSLFVLNADLRCNCWLKVSAAEREANPCQCVGDLIYQANCVECSWHVIGEEHRVIEKWHDHAWPGWRELPVVPADVRPRGGGMSAGNPLEPKAAKRAAAWVAEHYPSGWQIEGAPVLVERGDSGTRHVPGYSPWGGFDLCAEVAA